MEPPTDLTLKADRHNPMYLYNRSARISFVVQVGRKLGDVANLPRVNYRPHAPTVETVTTAMAFDAALELSVEQLVSVLNKKIFMECARIQLTAAPTTRTSVAALTAEVRHGEPEEDQGVLTGWFAGRRAGETSQRCSTRSDLPEELTTACQPSFSRNHRVVRNLRLRCRSETSRLLDPCLPVLAQSHHLQSWELGVDW